MRLFNQPQNLQLQAALKKFGPSVQAMLASLDIDIPETQCGDDYALKKWLLVPLIKKYQEMAYWSDEAVAIKRFIMKGLFDMSEEKINEMDESAKKYSDFSEGMTSSLLAFWVGYQEGVASRMEQGRNHPTC